MKTDRVTNYSYTLLVILDSQITNTFIESKTSSPYIDTETSVYYTM